MIRIAKHYTKFKYREQHCQYASKYYKTSQMMNDIFEMVPIGLVVISKNELGLMSKET